MATFVPFLTVEDSDDLIVSFGLGPHADTSLTLLRTPMYESLLLKEERGVSVGTGAMGVGARELLIEVVWGVNCVRIASTVHQYELDISSVDKGEIREAKAVLSKMNLDGRFDVRDV